MAYCCQLFAVQVFLLFSVGITMTFRRRLYQVSKEKDKLSFLYWDLFDLFTLSLHLFSSSVFISKYTIGLWYTDVHRSFIFYKKGTILFLMYDFHICLLTGKGTTHCTNGIVVQRIPLTCAPPPDIQVEEAHPKKHTVTHIATDVIPYHSGRQQGPAALQINLNQFIQSIPETTQRACSIDFAWTLCRQPFEDSLFALSAEHPQVIPAWTAFNIKLMEGRGLRESCVSYCPVIEASPTSCRQSTQYYRGLCRWQINSGRET